MKKILITGGAGFIGSHTCLVLLDKGYDLLIVDSLVNSYPNVINQNTLKMKIKATQK